MRSPSLTCNRAQKKNLAELARLLTAQPGTQSVLVIGAGPAGAPVAAPGISFVLTDVIAFPGIDVVCDAQELPFDDQSFDAVIGIAVLEHVPDPPRAVSEIYRVLRPGGLIYSEIPFLQQVHLGAWDFTRYTALGHRRLFRMFDTLPAEPVVAGPASSLAWALHGFVVGAFGRTRFLWRLSHHGSRYLLAWLPHLDRLLVGPAATDAACATAFLGRKRPDAVSDEKILSEYAGAVPTPTASM
jgi:SAM-dependent methyltransferase